MIIAKNKEQNKIIYRDISLSNLWIKLEELAFDYVNMFEKIEERYFNKSKSHKYGKVPYGYFMQKNRDKVTIMRKTKCVGFLYNTDKIEKIMTFTIVRPDKCIDRPFVKEDTNDTADKIREKIKKWIEIHKHFEAMQNGGEQFEDKLLEEMTNTN